MRSIIFVPWVGLIVAVVGGCDSVPVDDAAPSQDATTSDAPASDDAAAALPPTALITCVEGEEVLPETTMHCSAAASREGTGGAIVSFAWTLEQPSGSSVVLIPATVTPNVIFVPSVVGTYRLRLVVGDAEGVMSPSPSESVILVSQPVDVEVELTWSNPGDIGEHDSGMPSRTPALELHLLYPNASGWFDSARDHMGEGRVSVSQAEDGVYQVGVHVVDDAGYGTSWATVRVYLQGQLVWQGRDVQLDVDDLWEACTIAWPTREVTAIAEPPSILHDVSSEP